MSRNINSSLYVHIPFCTHICKYCDFTKLFYLEKFSNLYVKKLLKEIKLYAPKNLKTIYVGGGTPTSLNDLEFELLLRTLSKLKGKECEFTCEANVENLSDKKLQIMKKYGVNRISIGVQSTHNERLKEIGRYHSFENTINLIKKCRKYKFNNINVDLIFAYENQTIKELKEDLNNILSLNTEHISLYPLQINKGTIFYNQKQKELNEDKWALYYRTIIKFLSKHGYEHYEISNFAKNKNYSKHNLVYWNNQHYIGVGLGASGYIDNKRYTNTKNLSKYLNNEFIDYSEEVDKKKEIEYFLITKLRLKKGFLKSEFKKEFDLDFDEVYKEKIEKFINNKSLINTKYRIYLSNYGFEIMDFILRELF